MPVTSTAAVVLAAAQVITFATKDGWTIAATYRPAQKGRATVVLAHGVAASRQEWETFASLLSEKGVGTLTVDLRGHGGSTAGPDGKSDFNALDRANGWPGAVEDLNAAAAWLKAKGVPEQEIAFGGASIGANLASQVAARSVQTPFLLLLSPAPDYRGVGLLGRRGLETLAAASNTDPLAFKTVQQLADARVATPVYTDSGHGVQMFGKPLILQKVTGWTIVRAGGYDDLSIEIPWKSPPVTVRISGPAKLTGRGKRSRQSPTGCGFTIQWGDGSPTTPPGDGPAGKCSETLEHVYAATGTYSIQATIHHLGPSGEPIVDSRAAGDAVLVAH